MSVKARVFLIGLVVLLLPLAVWHLSVAQLDGLEGMEPPDDVSGVDCVMCHGDFAASYEFSHEPVLDGDCVMCHLETGDGTHGGLVGEGRELCLPCHTGYEGHNPVLNCWAASCHADKHGSDVDPLFNPSRQESYPGFCESTAGAEYVGSRNCLGCHCEWSEWWEQSMHSLSDLDQDTPLQLRGCEGCHGPGGNHWGQWAGIGYFVEANVEETDAQCFKCHKDEMFAPDYWKALHPLAGVSCTTCHNPHSQENKHNLGLPANELCLDCHKTTRADFNKMSHHPVDTSDPRTGMLCVECHDPHGAGGGLMLTESVEELCASCHLEKAGPFVYSHAGYDPALGGGCLTCHSNHGSNSPNLLLMNGRGLCLQCHTEMAAHVSGRNCWTSGCHTEHHGSNSSFFFFY
jgi:DmsE family decaheme c-type cytochrome